ncbi:Armadillo repeat-containing protein [Schistosoma japonicum]|nr:Armadillo repeat-containing protein [Schistosoma japonicum]
MYFGQLFSNTAGFMAHTSSIDSDVAQNLSTFDQPTDRDNSSGVSSLWQEVVARLETSVERYICSDDPLLVIKSIRQVFDFKNYVIFYIFGLSALLILRQFVVASVMNKLVVGNSPVLRPRLLNSLSRLNQWSTTHINVCIDLFGLVNSLVRDCSSLSEDILSHSELLTDFMNLILNEKTDPMVREADLLFLRSLFRAGDLSSVVAQSPREKIAVELFTETTLQILINSLLLSVPDTVSELSNNSNFTLRTSHQSILVLTPNARCSLIEILSLLSTSSELAERLHLCGALDLCHQTIMLISCRHRLRSGDQPKLNPMNRGKTLCNRIGCNRTISPSNQLAARFSLKLMLHLFFHLPNALDSFQKIYNEEEPIKLIACYSHLTGTMPPVSPNVCYSTPRYQRTKRVLSGTMSSANSTTITFTNNSTSVDTSTVTVTSPNEFYPDNKSRQFHQNSIDSATSIDKHSGSPCPVDSHITVSTCSCAPLDHGTFALTGLLRGLIYWRLANQYANAQTVEAVDQFGTHVITSAGLGITGDDIALLIIQPLTESCLHLEATRILTWACHVLVLVLDKSPELHMWTVYTNSFVREVDYRVTSLLKAVQEASDSQSHTQFLEHLIPLIKLFSCLASGHEATRILIGELTMCKKLIDFAMRLKSLGSENENIVLQFQHSVVVLLHVLSRSFSLHHTLFRNQTIGRYLLKLIDDNLPNTMQGSYLSAKLVEAASSCLINQALPMCPLKEVITKNNFTVFGASGVRNNDDAVNIKKYSFQLQDNVSITVHQFKGVWLELLQLASSIPNNEFNFSFPIKNEWEDNVAKITNFDDMNSGNRASTVPGIMVSQEDAEIKHIDELNQNNEKANDDSRQKYEANLNLFNCFNTHHQHHYRPHHSNNTNNEHQSLFLFNNKVQPKFKLSKNVAQIHVLIVYQTLSFLRNLLRDEHFIDTVVSKHWWNIAQFIVAVLESNYPQPVKEQAVLVVAHIATGRTARCEVHRNGDLVEKLTLFMRSQNSYTKAAALTATYYLLGLQTEYSCGLLSAFKVKHKPYILSHSRRLRVQHHRHETHHGKKQDLVNPTTSLVSCSMTRREASTCMAQNALEEEAEEEEANEDQDVVVEHGSDFLSGTISEQTSTITQMTDTAISFNIDDNHGNADQSRLRTLRRRRYYRSWQPTSPSISDNHEFCTDEDVDVNQHPVTLSSLSPTLTISDRAPLADIEHDEDCGTTAEMQHSTMTDSDLLSPLSSSSQKCEIGLNPDDVSSTEYLNNSEQIGNTMEMMFSTNSNQSESIPSTSQNPPPHPTSSSPLSNSRRDWETGFCYILLPFLQELDSDQILRSTWDWYDDLLQLSFPFFVKLIEIIKLSEVNEQSTELDMGRIQGCQINKLMD